MYNLKCYVIKINFHYLIQGYYNLLQHYELVILLFIIEFILEKMFVLNLNGFINQTNVLIYSVQS